MVVIDAKDSIVGRLGTKVAKMLLAGEMVEVINASEAVMMGSLVSYKNKMLSRKMQKNKRNPEESPKWPKRPDMLLRRMIRGMLPFRSQRGRDAYKRLRVYIEGKPAAVAGKKADKIQRIEEAAMKERQGSFTLLELCNSLGYLGKHN